jgi:hypothetical protein
MDNQLTYDLIHIELKSGNYKTPEQVAEYLNKEIAEQFRSLPVLNGTEVQGPFKLSALLTIEVNKELNVMQFKSGYPWLYLLTYNDELGHILGFRETDMKDGYCKTQITYKLNGPRASVFPHKPSIIYIYSDIIECERVGDSMSPLLRAVALTGRPNEEKDGSEMVFHVY